MQGFAMTGPGPCESSQRFVVGDHSPAIAVVTEILGGVKADGCGMSDSTRISTEPVLGAVFDHDLIFKPDAFPELCV